MRGTMVGLVLLLPTLAAAQDELQVTLLGTGNPRPTEICHRLPSPLCLA